MNITTLIADLALALADDTALKAWGQANYDRDHKVFVNLNPNDPPGAEECPYVGLYPTAKTVGNRRGEKSHGLEVVVCLYDDTLIDPARRANLAEYLGAAHIEALRKLAESALVTALELIPAIDEIEIEIDYETIEAFPFFFAGMALTVNETVCIGGNYLE